MDADIRRYNFENFCGDLVASYLCRSALICDWISSFLAFIRVHSRLENSCAESRISTAVARIDPAAASDAGDRSAKCRKDRTLDGSSA
jgi:hypothetical protein